MAFSQELLNIILEANTNDSLRSFASANPGPGLIRTPAILLCMRRYQFIDPNTGKMISGVSFIMTDGQIADNVDDTKGFFINGFSIPGDASYQNFSNFPLPPTGVFCDIAIGKRSSLRAVHAFERIKQLNLRTGPSTTGNINTGEGGN